MYHLRNISVSLITTPMYHSRFYSVNKEMIQFYKECRETLYWLALVDKTKLLPQKEIEDCLNEGKQLRPILATIIRNSKLNP